MSGDLLPLLSLPSFLPLLLSLAPYNQPHPSRLSSPLSSSLSPSTAYVHVLRRYVVRRLPSPFSLPAFVSKLEGEEEEGERLRLRHTLTHWGLPPPSRPWREEIVWRVRSFVRFVP